jgi:hypothetical protein
VLHCEKGIRSVPQSIYVDHIGLRTYRFENYCNWKCDVHNLEMYK